MRVMLVHNPEAGSGDHEGSDLLARLRAAGYDADYSTTEAASLSRALESAPDVVLAAGGDGTVGAVARLMATRAERTALAILPIGTANNIARSLGVHGSVDEIVAGLDSPARRKLDVGTARAPWGTARFVESVGVGVFAGMLRDAESENAAWTAPTNNAGRGARLRRMMDDAHARHWRIDGDGEDLSGNYLFAVAMNIAYVGPTLALAPAADPGDGRLDLVLVREDDRRALGEYFDALARGEEPTLAIPTRRVSRLRLEWSGTHGHVDDRLWPDTRSDGGSTYPLSPTAEIDAAGPPLPIVVPERSRS